MSHLDCTIRHLRARGVSEAILERVIRLNPNPVEGERLRGLHLTAMESREMFWLYDCIGKGEFLRRYGRDAFARVPRQHLRKRGRRVYVTRIGLQVALGG